jgi:hypothetical protein
MSLRDPARAGRGDSTPAETPRGRRQAFVVALAQSRLRWPVAGLLAVLIAGVLAAGHLVERAAL